MQNIMKCNGIEWRRRIRWNTVNQVTLIKGRWKTRVLNFPGIKKKSTLFIYFRYTAIEKIQMQLTTVASSTLMLKQATRQDKQDGRNEPMFILSTTCFFIKVKRSLWWFDCHCSCFHGAIFILITHNQPVSQPLIVLQPWYLKHNTKQIKPLTETTHV